MGSVLGTDQLGRDVLLRIIVAVSYHEPCGADKSLCPQVLKGRARDCRGRQEVRIGDHYRQHAPLPSCQRTGSPARVARIFETLPQC